MTKSQPLNQPGQPGVSWTFQDPLQYQKWNAMKIVTCWLMLFQGHFESYSWWFPTNSSPIQPSKSENQREVEKNRCHFFRTKDVVKSAAIRAFFGRNVANEVQGYGCLWKCSQCHGQKGPGLQRKSHHGFGRWCGGVQVIMGEKEVWQFLWEVYNTWSLWIMNSVGQAVIVPQCVFEFLLFNSAKPNFVGRRVTEPIQGTLPFARQAERWRLPWKGNAPGSFWTGLVGDRSRCHDLRIFETYQFFNYWGNPWIKPTYVKKIIKKDPYREICFLAI